MEENISEDIKHSPEKDFNKFIDELRGIDADNGDSPKKVIILVNNAVTAASDMETSTADIHKILLELILGGFIIFRKELVEIQN